MAWTPKVWVDRAVEFAGRRILTPTVNANEYDVTRSEGTIFVVGDEPDAENLNAEFGHVKTELDAINTNLNGKQNEWELIDTISHTVSSHSKAIDFTQYNDIKIVVKSANNLYCSEIPVEILGTTPLVFIIGGGFINASYGAIALCNLSKSSIGFTVNSITENSSALAGTFYIYVK